MTIADAREKCKSLAAKAPKDVLLVAILILASSASFGLGFSAGRDAAGQGQGSTLRIEVPAQGAVAAAAGADAAQPSPEATAGKAGAIVASKNGSKYYLPSCSGANRISDANKVWFASPAAAAAAGYAPAANCPGL